MHACWLCIHRLFVINILSVPRSSFVPGKCNQPGFPLLCGLPARLPRSRSINGIIISIHPLVNQSDNHLSIWLISNHPDKKLLLEEQLDFTHTIISLSLFTGELSKRTSFPLSLQQCNVSLLFSIRGFFSSLFFHFTLLCSEGSSHRLCFS